ncbi:MAG: zinc ribbon domain-containing protein [Actinobacteria bacterium]|nr:zinc ribbon domain-containing protein [Actinomycetota bacterium]
MSFCENCGKSLHEGARFCGACGAAVPDDKVEGGAAATAAQTPSAWSCPSCGTVNDAEAQFCSHCGLGRGVHASEVNGRDAATTLVAPPVVAPDQPVSTVPTAQIERGPASPVDGGPSAGGRFSRRWLIIALIAALAIVLLAVAAFVIVTRNKADGQKASDSFDSQSTAIVAPLAPMADAVASRLPVSLKKCAWSTKLNPAVRSAERLRTAVEVAQRASAALVAQNPSQTAAKQALDGAFKALGAYAEAVAGLPPQLSAVTPAQAQALRRDASAAKSACKDLSTAAAALPELAVNDCSVVPAGAHKARKDAVLRIFLIKVQNDILNQSQYGRRDIIDAVAGVDGMTMNPDDAATMIESVQSNRQSLLGQLSSMSVPDDRRATSAYDLLQQALQHSIEADRYYAAWMHKVYDYYYLEPQGYMGNVPHDDNYDAAVNQSSMAGSAKSRFCRVYNPLAKRFGLRHDWTEGRL